MLTVIPAYGRDYRSKAAILADWESGKDFQIADMSAGADDGRMINLADAVTAGIRQIRVRYAKLRKLAIFPVKLPTDNTAHYAGDKG